MLIARTRLIDVETRAEVRVFEGEALAAVDAALARLPARDRPAANRRGALALEHDLRCYVELDVRGTNDYGQVVVEYDVWPSQAARDAGQPAVFRNTHVFQLSTKPDADHRAMIEYHVREAIVRHALENRLGDARDRRIRPRADRDPHGWYADAGVQALRGRRISIDETAEPLPAGNRRLRTG